MPQHFARSCLFSLGFKKKSTELEPGIGGYAAEDGRETSVVNSDDFVLGIRLRKIWWDKGIRETSDKVVGRVLEGASSEVNIGSPDSGSRLVDDFEFDDPMSAHNEQRFVDESAPTKLSPLVWILPRSSHLSE